MFILVFIYVVVNAILLEAYLDTDGNVGNNALLLFNLPVLVLAILSYLISRIPLNK